MNRNDTTQQRLVKEKVKQGDVSDEMTNMGMTEFSAQFSFVSHRQSWRVFPPPFEMFFHGHSPHFSTPIFENYEEHNLRSRFKLPGKVKITKNETEKEAKTDRQTDRRIDRQRKRETEREKGNEERRKKERKKEKIIKKRNEEWKGVFE